MKIVLGTAQLTRDYGIANDSAKRRSEAKELLATARDEGIRYFDTSPLYDESESLLGDFWSGESPSYFTKIPSFKNCTDSPKSYAKKNLRSSLNNLSTDQAQAVFFHDPTDLKRIGQDLFSVQKALKSSGLAQDVGISVYTPEQAIRSLKIFEPDIIQFPVNVFDRRFLDRELRETLQHHSISLCGRSVFLQGLFFLEPDQLPSNLKSASNPLIKFHNILSRHEVSVPEATLGYVKKTLDLDYLVFGVDNSSQLSSNLRILEKNLDEACYQDLKAACSVTDPEIINPARWK